MFHQLDSSLLALMTVLQTIGNNFIQRNDSLTQVSKGSSDQSSHQCFRESKQQIHVIINCLDCDSGLHGQAAAKKPLLGEKESNKKLTVNQDLCFVLARRLVCIFVTRREREEKKGDELINVSPTQNMKMSECWRHWMRHYWKFSYGSRHELSSMATTTTTHCSICTSLVKPSFVFTQENQTIWAFWPRDLHSHLN